VTLNAPYGKSINQARTIPQNIVLDGIDQEEGNFNVFCQSCGRVIAVNIDSNQEALELESEHTQDSDCRYTGTHAIGV
jgi:hypothetical protein